jgi:hypothetical protein
MKTVFLSSNKIKAYESMKSYITFIKKVSSLLDLPHSIWSNTVEHSDNHILNLIKLSPELDIREKNIIQKILHFILYRYSTK